MKALPLFVGLVWLASSAPAQELSASARVNSNTVYVGQTFLLEIEVDGSSSPEPPDLSELSDNFQIQDAGGGSRNSQSIAIVNGRLSRQVTRGYTFRYQLLPKGEGRLGIPSIPIKVDDRTVRTDPIEVLVSPPTEVADFKLRSTLSSSQAYVGQPLLLRTTWYVGRNVDQVSFGMPLLNNDAFEFADQEPQGQVDRVELFVNDRPVIAQRVAGRLDGREYLTVTFTKVLIPKQPGRFELPSSTASFRAASVVRQAPNPFGGFFGGALFERTMFEDIAIPSNGLTLEVSALPLEGRPPNFSGLVGSFELSASASPTDVRVGEPVNVEVSVSGPAYVEYVRLPPLSALGALGDGFAAPTENPRGLVNGDAKVFTQALRPRRVDVTEIPSLALNYFNPATARYETARTSPIPLTVETTRLITAADLGDLGTPEGDTPPKPRLAPIDESPSALQPGRTGLAAFASPAWLLAFATPPLAFMALLAVRRRQDAAAEIRVNAEAESSLRELASLAGGDAFAVVSAVKRFLGAKLGLTAAALTFADVRAPLADAGAAATVLEELAEVFRIGDEARFAGGGAVGSGDLSERALEVCRRIDGLEALR